ncbi:metallophosphoesterase family protein [uncultured Jatrophihabitans sp.]|uniref:metallophosphoesterase family protein n=1 Tax=uncultured Jatrophihabitans sp. TaxID=1610747 RepID=UPI0035C98BEA
MRVAVLSDTHSPRFWKRCPPAVAAVLDGVDAILHAGDVCLAETLDELAQFAPVHAVRGNNDGPDVAAWGAPDTLRLELGGLPVGMVHDSGPAQGRGPRLRRLFPDARLVVFGHSHIPWDVELAGQRAFNPGSPTDKRRQPRGTMGELVIIDGELAAARIFPVT